MPRRDNTTPSASTALALPDDIRADLLRAQAEQIETPTRLPRVKIMPAGAGLYEFSDNGTTPREFRGVILHSHARNVLWDRAFGTAAPAPAGERAENHPACTSDDGRYGTPRPGFAHAALGGEEAIGDERIECRTCPYNQWGSGRMINPTGNQKGKAVSNTRSVFILIEGRETPVELALPATSLRPYDEYLQNLLTQGLPMQAVVTFFGQERKEGAGGNRWGVATFRQDGTLSQEQLEAALAARNRWRDAIFPADPNAVQGGSVAGPDTEPRGADFEVMDDDDSDLPF